MTRIASNSGIFFHDVASSKLLSVNFSRHISTTLSRCKATGKFCAVKYRLFVKDFYLFLYRSSKKFLDKVIYLISRSKFTSEVNFLNKTNVD